MSDRITTDDSPSMATLLGGIVGDVQTLVRQEVTLAKTEIQQEWQKAKTAAASMAIGAAVLAFGGFLLCFVPIYALHEAAGLPLWASYLLVGGSLAILGVVLFLIGRGRAGEVNLVPPQTAASIKENVAWIQNPK